MAAAMVLQARCGKRRQGPCRINFMYPDGTETIPMSYLCAYADCGKHEHLATVETGYGTRFLYMGEIPVKEAAERMVYCLSHRSPMSFKALKGGMSTDPCGPGCREAEGGSCKCSCGGMNHGIDV